MMFSGSGGVDVFPARMYGNIPGELPWSPRAGNTFTLAPCHLACLNICYLILDCSTEAEATFNQGGPPSSMADIFQVIKSRVWETPESDSIQSTPIALFEPSRYGLNFFLERTGWEGKNFLEEKADVS